MSPINNNASALAVMIETVEGEPELASASGDFMPIIEGFELSPETEVLESEEITATIARAASAPGIERVNGTFDEYIKGSGVEGQAPRWGKFLQSMLGGRVVQTVEVATISGSTTKILRVASGDSADLMEGQAILVKDPVNGRNIRNISEIVTGMSYDEIYLNFALPVAPGAGVNLGLAVVYYGVDSGHASLTYDLFRGNGGAREVASGMKVTEAAFAVAANEYIRASFPAQGRKYHFDAIEIDATTKYFDFHDGTSDYSVSVAEKVYRDTYELIEALISAANDAGSLATLEGTWNDYGTSKGKFTIESDIPITIKWLTGANNANSIGEKLGFDTSANDGPATSFTSDTVQDWSYSPLVPSFDVADANVAKAAQFFIGGVDDTNNVCARELNITSTNEVVERACISSDTGVDSVGFTRRTTTWEVNTTLEPHEVRYFAHYRKNDNVAAMLNFGERVGGNFVAGKSINMYTKTAKIVAVSIEDDNGDAVLNMTLQAHVESGETKEFIVSQV